MDFPKRLFYFLENKVRTLSALLHLFVYQRSRAFFQYKRERQALRGKLPSPSDAPSILLFTGHKCASVFVGRILAALAEETGRLSVNYDDYFARTGGARFQLYDSPEFYRVAFRATGFFYGPFRGYNDLPGKSGMRVVLHLRDPRDVLTSQYFSWAYSHQVLNQRNLEDRNEALRHTVDSFVLENAAEVGAVYARYLQHLTAEVPHALILRYEEMVQHFSAWLDTLCHYCGFAAASPARAKILAETDFKVRENIHAHKRQVTPGDYLRKLQPATIATLNQQLAPVLARLGY